MAFTKRVMSKTKKIFIYGGGTLASFLILLFSLSFYGVNVQTSGDQVCGETCVSYFNISLDSYALCMGSTFTGITVEPQVKYEIYKADARYRSDNPNRWKPYDFKASTCLKNGTNHEFKLVGYKNPEQTIKWGLTLAGPDKDPFWYGINESAATTSVSNNITMELGARINISTNISGASTVCVDIDHPEYGDNYTCGSPNANFLVNISYFRKTEFNDSAALKNISWVNGGNNTLWIRGHQYDEIKNVSLNVTGFLINNTFPTNVKIYVNNTLSNNLGRIYSGNIALAELNDSSTTKNLTFTRAETKTIYLKIPKNAQISSAHMNISGLGYSECYQESANTTNQTNIDGNCYLNYSGAYTFNDYTFSYRTNDGEWNTYGYATPTNIGNITINYTKPNTNTPGATWKFKRGTGIITDTTIPTDCLNYSDNKTVQLRISTNSGASPIYTDLLCYNGTWKQLQHYTTYSVYVYEESMNWSSLSYPLNPFLTIFGDNKWNYSGNFNVTNNKTTNLNDSIMDILGVCSADSYGYCTIPLYFTSGTAGIIQISSIQINYSYNPNPIYLNKDIISSFLNHSNGFADIPLKFESSLNGTLQISDLRYDYGGGNDTISVLTFNFTGGIANRSQNDTLNLIYYYSDFYKNLPYTWTEDIFFLPKTNSSKNVTAYGQTSTIPVYNITTTNYGGKNMNLSIAINETNACINITYNTNSTKPTSSDYILNTTWKKILYSATTVIDNSSWCYQETANVSTGCGDLNTGSYFNSTQGDAGYIQVNYTVPINATNQSLIQIKYSCQATQNYSIPSVCWGIGNLSLKIDSYNMSIGSMYYFTNLYCWNGASWTAVGGYTGTTAGTLVSGNYIGNAYDGNWDTGTVYISPSSGWYNQTGTCNSGEIFEEAMYWRIQNNYSLTVNTMDFKSNPKIWLWADLTNCNASNQRILNPWVELQSYCIDCKWEGS